MGFQHNDIAVMGGLRAALNEEINMIERNDIVTTYKMNKAIAEGGGGGGLMSALASATFSGITEIPDKAFQSNSTIMAVFVDSSCAKVGDYAFADATSLYTFDTSEYGGVFADIGNYAFTNTPLYFMSLNAVDGSSYFTIGDHAFDGCSAMESAFVSNPSHIGDYAFANCSSLSQVYLRTGNGFDLPTAGENIFGSSVASGFTIYVIAATVSELASLPGWSQYSSYMSQN